MLIVAGLVICFLQYKNFVWAQAQLQQEEVLLAEDEVKLAALKVLQQRTEQLAKEQETLLGQLPLTAKEEQFLVYMQSAADLSGMDLIQVRFAERIEGEGYTEMPLEMTLAGTYHQLLDLLAYLEVYERAVRLQDLRAEKVSEEERLMVILNASIFYAQE